MKNSSIHKALALAYGRKIITASQLQQLLNVFSTIK